MNMISDTLKQVISDSGISFRRLEKETGVSRLIIARFVRGETQMRIDSIDTLCDFFNLELTRKKRRKA